MKTDRPEEALQFLRTVDSYRSTSIHNDGLNVELDLERIPELNRQLVTAGFKVNSLIPQRTLETYFLNLIEGREPCGVSSMAGNGGMDHP